MTGTTPPPEVSSLPCQLDPERWFDHRNRAGALADCLSCPARRWCAREALQCRASWGLWAGVWIDGPHDDAMAYLEAIATDDFAQGSPRDGAVIDARRDWEVTPLHPPSGSSRPRSISAAVLARSCGHCEVFADGCRYTYERLVSRHPSIVDSETATPSDVFAACSSCAEMVAVLNLKLAIGFGYVLDAHRDSAHVPFYWRGSRWVLLDRDGWLTEMPDHAETA
jgi:hypothetical protein